VGGLFAPSAEPHQLAQQKRAHFDRGSQRAPGSQQTAVQSRRGALNSASPWTPLEQALRSCDLLLQTGGFSAIVLDMAGIAAEYASRIPLASWFRYRAAAERTQASILLLTQTSCAKSSAELLLRFEPARAIEAEPTVFTGFEATVEVARRRFAPAEETVTPFRKPPQSVRATHWTSHAAWAGQP